MVSIRQSNMSDGICQSKIANRHDSHLFATQPKPRSGLLHIDQDTDVQIKDRWIERDCCRSNNGQANNQQFIDSVCPNYALGEYQLHSQTPLAPQGP